MAIVINRNIDFLTINNLSRLAGNTIYAIQEDSKGMLWVGTGNHGLSLFDRSSDEFYNHQYDKNATNSINNSGINSIHASDGQMWVGTFTGGVNYTDKIDPQIYHYKNDPNRLSHNSVRSFLEIQYGTILIGTDGGGLNFFDRDSELFSSLKYEPGNGNSIPSNVILDMEEHPYDEHVWLGAYNGGLSLFNIENETFSHYQHDPSDSTSLSSNDIFELYVDVKDRLWIGTNGGGVSMLRPGFDEFIRYMQDTEDSTTIDNNDIRSFYEDSKGIFWIGTYGGQANNSLNKHKDDLKEFLLEYPRGMKLLHYYLKLNDPMDKEYEKLQAHCSRLTDKVQLMLEVIDAQQDFAKVGRISEKVQLEEIVEDILTLQSGSIERHDLDIEKKFVDTNEVSVQKNKLIHILINLFSNEKEAIAKKLLVRKKLRYVHIRMKIMFACRYLTKVKVSTIKI